MPPGCAQFCDNTLRLAERVGSNKHAAFGVRGTNRQKAPDLFGYRRMAEHRQTKRCLSDEEIAGGYRKRRASGIRAAFVVASNDDPLAGVLQQNLR